MKALIFPRSSKVHSVVRYEELENDIGVLRCGIAHRGHDHTLRLDALLCREAIVNSSSHRYAHLTLVCGEHDIRLLHLDLVHALLKDLLQKRLVVNYLFDLWQLAHRLHHGHFHHLVFG